MSHCRFENTHDDLLECFEVLNNSDVKSIEEDANEYERPYIKKLIEVCCDISDMYKDELW